MFKYLAIVWNPLVPSHTELTELVKKRVISSDGEWHCDFQSDGLAVFSTGKSPSCRVYSLYKGRGVILGTVFRRPTNGENQFVVTEFDNSTADHVIESEGQSLIESYWGRYVAFLLNQEERSCHVLRSPTGELDCFYAEVQGVRFYCSCVSDLVSLELTDYSMDWDYISADLCVSISEAWQTGLQGIKRVLHGELITHGIDAASKRFLWHPLKVAKMGQIENEAEAANALKTVTHACVRAWASQYSSILELLSGGLDSSILLCGLHRADASRRVVCLNLRTPNDPSTDERPFARLLTSRFNCRLVEHEMLREFSFVGRLKAPLTAVPINSVYMFDPDDVERRISREYKTEAIFSGHGGDQLFYQSGATFACHDYIRSHGPGPSAFGIAMDAARLEGESVWSVLFKKASRSPHSLYLGEFERVSLVSAPARDNARKQGLNLHPWLLSGEPALPGKWWHAVSIAAGMDTDLYGPSPTHSGLENVAALMSQPLVETCLRIPTYLLMSGAQDRALARRAFSKDLPKEIVRRRFKGTTYDSAKVLLSRNLDFARDLLLSGTLVRERILDRAELERALSRDTARVRGYATHILKYVACEAWIQSWCSKRHLLAT